MKTKRALTLTVLFFSLICCGQKKLNLIDAKATAETKAVFQNLYELSKEHILFGHQHATEYGHGWSGEEGRSDVKSVTGSHPAVIGVDFLALSGRPENEIVDFQ